MKKLSSLILLLSVSLIATAQQVRPAKSTQIYHELKQLKHLTNVLYFAAHPDDENTRMLTWLVNDQHIPTAYLSLTRGDGGQNILGPHLGPSLGLIRTHELLEARKLDGANQFFSRAVDFGYSKTADETFKHWDKDQLIHDAVFVIRTFKPDVIICRFPPNENAGHGQHAASAIIAHEAFNAAGDNDKYTDQFSLVEPWQPKRILFNAYRFGSRNTTSEDQFKLDVGQYNALLGMGYGELAGISRSIHRSQGAGTRSVPGVQTEYLDLVDGEPLKESLFDGIDITWGRIGRADIGEKVQTIIDAYDFNHPEKSLPALLSLYKEVKNVKDNQWKQQKLSELKDLILHTAGFMAEAYTATAEVTQGELVPFTFNFITRSGDVKVKLLDVQCVETDTACQLFMPNDELVSLTKELRIPENTPYTQPYWLSKPQADPAHYPIPNKEELGLPNTPNNLVAQTHVLIGDEEFLVDIPLSYKTLDATHGDVVEQLRVVPDLYVEFTSGLLITNNDGSVAPSVRIHANAPIENGTLTVYNDDVTQEITNINLAAGGDTVIKVNFTGKYLEPVFYKNNEITLYAQVMHPDGEAFHQRNIRINYEHLPTLQYYTAAYTKVLKRNWECKAKKVAYIEGAGDEVSEVLNFAGINVEVLEEADITPANLKKYDAVMVGIRAINVKEKAPIWMPYLLEYTKNGGTLIMQYNTSHRMTTDDIGPYPLHVSRDRVTEEDAEMTLLVPDHKLLTYPNKLTKEDFDGWVQERGLYFADTWDEHYTPLFSMHDEGEEPLKGGTLYTEYGKGHYIFTPISFFRQLPAANTGALRLLCNFLSAGN